MNIKIAIIKENINEQLSLKSKLSIEGFYVEVIDCYSEKNNIIRDIINNNYDYVVLDASLNKVKSKDVVGRIKSDDNLVKTKIIVLGKKDEEKKEFDNIGVEYYIQESNFTIDELTVKIKNIIKNKIK